MPEPDHISPRPMTVDTPAGPMPAQLWTPAETTGPGLVLLHEIFGVGAYMQARAADLAALGYVVLAPEIYWRLGPDAIETARRDDLDLAVQLAGKVDWDQAVADGVSALAQLGDRPEVSGGVGLLGFCFGGGLAFAVAAEADPDVMISYYGSSLPSLLHLADRVTAPSLHHFGLADDYLPPETVRTIEAGVRTGPHVRVETYPGANHAFDNPWPGFHHAEASRTAWDITTRFLADQLPTRSG